MEMSILGMTTETQRLAVADLLKEVTERAPQSGYVRAQFGDDGVARLIWEAGAARVEARIDALGGMDWEARLPVASGNTQSASAEDAMFAVARVLAERAAA